VDPGHLQSIPRREVARAGINLGQSHAADVVEAPWGGYKTVGIRRELGPWGMEEYLETKQVFVQSDEAAHRLY